MHLEKATGGGSREFDAESAKDKMADVLGLPAKEEKPTEGELNRLNAEALGRDRYETKLVGRRRGLEVRQTMANQAEEQGAIPEEVIALKRAVDMRKEDIADLESRADRGGRTALESYDRVQELHGNEEVDRPEAA